NGLNPMRLAVLGYRSVSISIRRSAAAQLGNLPPGGSARPSAKQANQVEQIAQNRYPEGKLPDAGALAAAVLLWRRRPDPLQILGADAVLPREVGQCGVGLLERRPMPEAPCGLKIIRIVDVLRAIEIDDLMHGELVA